MPESVIMDAQTFAQASGESVPVAPVILGEIPPNFGIREIPIYLYNISNQEFNEPCPPNHPHLLIRRCPKGQQFLLVGQETHPFMELVEDQNGNKSPIFRDGFREVSRMLNPQNPGFNGKYEDSIRVQDFDDANSINVKRNLNQFGVFWSRSLPPLNEELLAARERMEKTYRAELEKMAAIEARNPDEARSVADWTSHAAADYFGVSTSWHRTDLIPKNAGKGKVACGACGEDIFSNARICRHCGAPTDPAKQEAWIEEKTSVRRGPGRPPKE
jgi:hypothetical protein